MYRQYSLVLGGLLCIALSLTGWGQGISVPSERVLQGSVQQAAPIPMAVRKQLRVDGIQLAPLAPDAIEDVISAEKGVLVIGVRRPLPELLEAKSTGTDTMDWQLVEGRWVSTLSIQAPGATGMRVHFTEHELPVGSRLLVYDGYTQDQVWPCAVNSDSLWSPTVYSDLIVVECALPVGAGLDGVTFGVSEVMHNFRDPWQSSAKGAAGSCNNPTPCFPDWEETALGVGGIASVGSNGGLWCTGSILADTDPITRTPFFLTANHCVSGESGGGGSANIEVYWFYEMDSCGGSVPSVATVPRSVGGADFLAGNSVNSGTDVTLLRLRFAPPAGLTWLGWRTAALGLGDDIVGIHHPSGDFKRISFGDKVDSGSPQSAGGHLQSLDRFHEILWNDGTTEPASSGSPIFLASTAQVVGQLWGGRASCTLTNEPDYYGRFDVSYSVLEFFLAGAFSPFDLDRSGTVDSVDLQIMANAAVVGTGPRADMDSSGVVNALDIELMIQEILGN